jgi:hypothetical protein
VQRLDATVEDLLEARVCQTPPGCPSRPGRQRAQEPTIIVSLCSKQENKVMGKMLSQFGQAKVGEVACEVREKYCGEKNSAQKLLAQNHNINLIKECWEYELSIRVDRNEWQLATSDHKRKLKKTKRAT